MNAFAALLASYDLDSDDHESNLAALATMSRQRLGALGGELAGHFDAITAGEIEGVEPDDLEQLNSVARAVEVVRAERERRTEPEPVTVAATNVTSIRPASTVPALDTIAPPAAMAPAARTSSSRGESRHGREITTLADLADEFAAAQQELSNYGRATTHERHRVATLRGEYPPDRVLSEGDTHGNNALVASAVSETQALVASALGDGAMVASGGWCAPPDARYDQLVVAVDSRPVRDALVNFGADRGSVSFSPPPRLSDVVDGVGVWTNAVDTNPGEATKNIVTATCPTVTTVALDAVTQALKTGNFSARAYPERFNALLQVLGAQHARTAEANLLDKIGAGSTPVTSVKMLGLVRDVLANMSQAAAAYRSRNRMAPDAALQVLVPAWVRDAIRADLARQQPGDDALTVADSEIAGYLAAAHLAPSWYLDSETGAGQVFGAQGPTDLRNWPTTVVWYLFAPGSWLFLDAGTLDLGIVRDSVLNATNDLEYFSESFESAAFVGLESLKVTSTVCPDGMTAIPVTSAGLCTAS